jgi:hypothetical protein
MNSDDSKKTFNIINNEDTKNTVLPFTSNNTLNIWKSWWEKRDAAEQQRMQQWRDRQAREGLSFEWEVKKEENGRINVSVKNNENNNDHSEKLQASMCAATGSASFEYSKTLFSQTLNAVFGTDLAEKANTINGIHEALIEMAPKDTYEGMLCSRLIVIHDQYMEYMKKATTKDLPSTFVDLKINRATKLMRIFNETLEALNKYRRKGEQRVIVQHVNVNNGNQAIVNGQ